MPMPSLVLTSSLTQLLYDARRTIMLKAGLTRVLSEGATFLLVALKHISHPSFELNYLPPCCPCPIIQEERLPGNAAP